MANVTFRCPKCEVTVRIASLHQTSSTDSEPPNVPAADADADKASDHLVCTACGFVVSQKLPADELVNRCLVCSSSELFVRKDFPQRLGLFIVVLGFAASSITYFFHHLYWTYAILFATALVDVVLWVVMGNVLECYRCHSQFRGIPELENRDPFDLEIQERYRQQAARLKQQT